MKTAGNVILITKTLASPGELGNVTEAFVPMWASSINTRSSEVDFGGLDPTTLPAGN